MFGPYDYYLSMKVEIPDIHDEELEFYLYTLGFMYYFDFEMYLRAI